MAQISQNIFDDCFDEKGDGNLHPNTYEVILAQSVDLRNSKLEELRMHRDQVRDDSEAIQQVEKDVRELDQIMADLSRLIHDQNEVVDSIEEHIEKTTQEVASGYNELKQAEKAKSAKYPAMAAAVGGIAVGGPVGFVAGSAIAGLAGAIGGAVAGLYSGRAFKKRAI